MCMHDEEEFGVCDFDNTTFNNEPTIMEGLTAAMEVAGVESIPGARPDRIVIGFSEDDD